MRKLFALSGPTVMLVAFATAAISNQPLSSGTAAWLVVGAVATPTIAAITRAGKTKPVRMEPDPSWSPLHHAVNDSQLETVKELIKSGFDPDVPDVTGTTPLHLAVQLGNGELVTELVGSGADATAVDASGSTALVMAMVRRNLNLVGPLLEAGADPDRANGMGISGRSLAAELGQPDLIR